ncbi:MAG: coenzyme F420-0:L-glutamate ligase [Anaerolineales bacterium]|nr:coenzyme F420-0:L-glutamate ligase [Anaerolineales bacterium]
MPLTLTPLSSIPLIRPGDNLAGIILAELRTAHIELKDNDILVITSKIVSKVEGRLVNLTVIKPSKEAIELATRSARDTRMVELILQESREVLRVRPGTIIVEHRLGFVCANAGIDHSNVSPPLPPGEGTGPALSEVEGVRADDWVLLLPEDPDRSAAEIRHKLEAASGVRLGVMIIDSHGRAWRLGTVGMTIGLSGLPGVVDERGWQDLFGYTLQITVVGVADELAAAASLVMGQAAEATPVVHVRGFPYPLREGSLGELLRPKEQDMFR